MSRSGPEPGSRTDDASGADATLIGTERRLSRILDGILSFVGTLTPEGVLTEANAPAIEASGLDRDQLIGRPFPECYWWNHSPEVQARLRDAIGRARSGETVRYDEEVRIKGEGRMWIDFRIIPGFDETGRVTELIASGVDITARKLGEAALRQKEERLRFALTAGALGDWDYDPATGLVTRSARHDEIFGYPEPLERWTVDHFLDHVVPEERERVAKAFQDMLSSGDDWMIECRIRRADGRDAWIKAQGKPILDDAGALSHLVGIIMDVTESKEYEAALSEQDERLRLALDVGQLGVWDWDIATDRAEWTDMHFTLLGYEVGSVPAGMDAWRVRVHPDDLEEIDGRIAKAIENGGDVSASYRLRHPGGRVIHVYTRSQFVRDESGKPVRMIGVMADITGLTEANLRADLNERRLDNVFANAPVGLAYHDGDLRFRVVNAKMAGFVDKPIDAFIGKTPRELDPAFGALIEPVLFAAMLSSEPTHDVEIRMPRRNGVRATCLVNCDVDRDSAGDTTGINVAVQDITDIKTAEHQRRVLLRELAHRVSNSLNVIQSIARQTLISSPDPADFARAIIGRINSLAATHAIITGAEWLGADLGRVLRAQLGLIVPTVVTRVSLEGPEVSVPPELASNIGLLIHELAANAAKFGALSAPEGHVEIVWKRDGDTLELDWVERGGPPIAAPPTTTGFGTRLGHMTGASVERIYDPEGLTFRLVLRLQSPTTAL